MTFLKGVSLSLLVLVLSCEQPVEMVYVNSENETDTEEDTQEETREEPEPTTTQEEPEDVEKPEQAPELVEDVWKPEPGTLYLFYDELGGELYISEKPLIESWRSRYFVYRQYAIDNNMVFAAGDQPEEII